MPNNPTWTKENLGIQHYGKLGDVRRVTVIAYKSFSLLHCWYPGCEFSPYEYKLSNADEARKAGEIYVEKGLLPAS